MGVRVGRLTRRPEYLRVAAARRRAVTSTLILQMAESWQGADAPSRIGFTASKKAVGNAVHRNRARRRLKAAAALILPAHAAGGRDYVAIARESAFDAPFERLTADLAAALKKLGAWVDSPSSPPSATAGGGLGGGGDALIHAAKPAAAPTPTLPHAPQAGLPRRQAGGGRREGGSVSP